MQAVLDELDAGIKTPPIEGTIVIRDGGANATPYGVLIKAWVRKSTLAREGAATVAMFSTRHWEITASKGPRTNYTSAGTRYSQEANCEEFSGTSGFSVNVFRFFRDKDSGKVLRKEKFHTDYIAGDNVICGSPPVPEPEPKPQPKPKPKTEAQAGSELTRGFWTTGEQHGHSGQLDRRTRRVARGRPRTGSHCSRAGPPCGRRVRHRPSPRPERTTGRASRPRRTPRRS